MDLLLWVILCLFASVGIVQVACVLICRSKRPPWLSRGYHVIPLYNDPEHLEAQLRYHLTRLTWGAGEPCEDPVLLLDTGMDDEARKICEAMLHDRIELQVCDAETLLAVMQRQKSATSRDAGEDATKA